MEERNFKLKFELEDSMDGSLFQATIQEPYYEEVEDEIDHLNMMWIRFLKLVGYPQAENKQYIFFCKDGDEYALCEEATRGDVC